MNKKITDGQLINSLEVGAYTTIRKIRFGGTLQARKLSTGATQFYWRYTFEGRTDRVPVGPYDPLAPPKSHTRTARGYSISAAEIACEQLAQQHQAARPAGGYRAAVAAQRTEQLSKRAEDAERKSHTLQSLLDAYCNYLEALGRPSHRDARSIFKLHVYEAKPRIASLAASDVTAEQIADLMRGLIEAGKGRTANKLRAYLRSAYQIAKSAALKPSVPLAFKAFAIKHNPASDTEADSTQNRADKDPLTVEELQHYWKCIRSIDGRKGAALRLHLLTGGQRIEQLVKLRTTDVTKASIKLFDRKGRPGAVARAQVVPLIAPAAECLAALDPSGEFALSTDGGESHIAATTLSGWAKAAVGETIEHFQAKRIRSGIETLLASRSISQEVRGRLQSHGLAGVQDRHYNAYDYLPEKEHALNVLFQALEPSRRSSKKPTASHTATSTNP